MNLTPAQTAALRAAVDGKNAHHAASAFYCHAGGGRRAFQRASATCDALVRRGLLSDANGRFDPIITDEGRMALPGSDPAALKDLLDLVSTDVPLEVVQRWTWDERAAAEDWAGRLHLRASDNIIRVPPVPTHVEPYRENATDRALAGGRP